MTAANSTSARPRWISGLRDFVSCAKGDQSHSVATDAVAAARAAAGVYKAELAVMITPMSTLRRFPVARAKKHLTTASDAACRRGISEPLRESAELTVAPTPLALDAQEPVPPFPPVGSLRLLVQNS